MIFENSRLGSALRVAFYPALEPAEAKRLQDFISEAQNARNAGNLAGAEQVYCSAHCSQKTMTARYSQASSWSAASLNE
jgi:hypothetical protein